MRNVMSWIKLISANIIVFISLILFVEIGAGISRLMLGKKYIIPFNVSKDIEFASSPCVEMKTDVLLSWVPNSPESCAVKDGYAVGEYIAYSTIQDSSSTVLILGGSTSSGFDQHYSDGDTWPKIFADSVGSEYLVLNGAIGGYSSLQELYKVIRDLPRLKNVKTIISLNGANELPNYHGNNSERSSNFPFLTDIQYSINDGQIWVDQRVKVSFFEVMLPNINSLVRYMYSNKSYLKNTISTSNSVSDELIYRSIDAADRWEINVRRIDALAAQMGAEYYVFLQPTLGLKGLQSLPPTDTGDEKLLKSLSEEYITEIRTLYQSLKSKCQLLKFCFDISDVAHPTGHVYSDARHHNADGNKIISRAIYERFILENTYLE